MYQIDSIRKLFVKYGERDYIGESVSQQSHLIQTAMLAEQANANPQLVVAAFLHDIGQFVGMLRKLPSMEDLGIADHERVGANFLRALRFPEYTARLVEEHVNAKRYLVSTKRRYQQQLSEASSRTLALQGGLMNVEEVAEFENLEVFPDVLRLRRWDDLAKRTDLQLKSLDYYLEICQKVL